MLAFSEIIDFLLNLMRDENARAEFEQDPQGTLARAGLEGVTGQDISDARLSLADSGAVRTATDDGGSAARSSSYQDDADPVRQINYTTQQFQAEDSGPAGGSGGGEPNLQQSSPSINEGDSFFFQTFSSDDDVTIIDDSFNTIDNSTTDVALTNIEATNSFNEGSFTSDDDVVTIDAENSFNSSDDDTVVAIRDDDTIINDTDVLVAENSFNETGAPDGSLAAVSPPSQLPPADSAGAEEPAAEEPAAEEPAPEEPAAEEPAFEEPAGEEPAAEDAAEEDSADEALDDPTDTVPV
jgi:hypothetical protein